MSTEEFPWTRQQRQAAILLGTTFMTKKDVAASVGVTVEELRSWRKRPEFADKLRELEEEELEEVRRLRYGRKSSRIRELNNEIEAIDRVFEARSRDFGGVGEENTGGDTGRIVRRYKGFGGGPFLEVRTEYEVDTPTIKTKADLMKQMAQELNEFGGKFDTESTTENSITITFEERSDGPE